MRARRPTRRAVIKGAGILAAAGTAFLAWRPRAANAYYSGPVSDHFDGRIFFNGGHDGPKSFAELLRWNLLESSEPWPDAFPSPHPPLDAPALAHDASSNGAVRMTYVGHASFLIQTQGKSILVDPVWSERASPVQWAGPRRKNPPAIALDALPKIDAIVVTHNHYDHMDIATLDHLAERFAPRIVTPLGNDTILRTQMRRDLAGRLDIRAVDWGDTTDLGQLRLHTVPTLHWSARGMRDRRHALWASFVLETPSKRIYHVGDTGFGDGAIFKDIRSRFGEVDAALLPIGAYEPRWFMKAQHMNPADAVAAFELLGAKRALGHHWGTFKLTNEGIDTPARDLGSALSERGIDPTRFVALRPGAVTEIE